MLLSMTVRCNLVATTAGTAKLLLRGILSDARHLTAPEDRGNPERFQVLEANSLVQRALKKYNYICN